MSITTQRALPIRASYQASIIDVYTGNRLALLDSTVWQRLRYNRAVRDIGIFMMSLPADHVAAQHLCQLDQLIEVTRYPTPGISNVEETYLLRHRQQFLDDDDTAWLVVGGFALDHLLKRRVINPSDDPLEAGGYSTKSGAADDVMNALVDEQLGPLASTGRKIDTLTLTASPGEGNTVGGRWRYENLYDMLTDLVEGSGTDFQLVRGSGLDFVFTAATIGEDRSQTANFPGSPQTVFAPERGTMLEPQFDADYRQEKTYIYLLGDGQGDDREVYEMGSSRLSASPLNRIEFAQDAQTLDEGASPTEFLTQAAIELEKNRPRIGFEFEIPQRLHSSYGTNWDLGDIISASWRDLSLDLRIMQVEVDIAQDERITLKTEIVRWT